MLTKENFKMDFVIPYLNYDGILKTLSSIRKHTPEHNIGKIILIDQGKEYLKEADEFVDLHLFTRGINIGFAKAMNWGLRLSDAEYTACWNDDAECINAKWIEGIVETFNRYSTALCVNPASPRNPISSGAPPASAEGYDYKEEWTTEEYDEMVTNLGRGYIIDGICMFATIFHRARLDKVQGVVPGKSWFDEVFHSGGEDYDLNRRGYLTKNLDNNYGGYRCLGTNLSYIFHWWYSTKKEDTGEAGVKYDGGTFIKKWRGDLPENENPDIYGHNGLQEIPQNIIRPW